MALRVVEAVEVPVCPGTARLTGMLVELAGLTADALGGVDDGSSEADLVDQIALAERLRAAVVAVQAATTMRLARSRVERENGEGSDPAAVGRGLAEEVGLACRISPTLASRRLGSARAWWFDLPCTYAALALGRLSERIADAVVSETRHLDASTRRSVDARLEQAELSSTGSQEAIALVRKLTYEADPHAYVARGRHERRHRRVGLRPAPDTMSVLSGYLPVEQGVACLAALRRHTDRVVAHGDERTRNQIMADTLVERLTGQATAQDVSVEVQIILPIEALDGTDDTRTATLTGAGPLPGPLARDLVDHSDGSKRVRRLYRSASGRLVGTDQRRRRFSGRLADLVVARDQTCREPFCGAPVRHLDHVRRFSDGGSTTLPNGRGLCARHNYTRERPGWSATVLHDGLGPQPHTVQTTTPTGHRYSSRAPDPP